MSTCLCNGGRLVVQQRRHALSARWRGRPALQGSRAQSSMPAPRKVLLTNDDGPGSVFFKAWVPHVQQMLGWVQPEHASTSTRSCAHYTQRLTINSLLR